MRRTRASILLALGALTAVAIPAAARITEVGRTANRPVPSCPAQPCLAVSRTTGFQVAGGGRKELSVAPRDGRVVAWKVTLGDPTKRQISFFNERLGGKASARIAILRPPPKGSKRYRLTGQSELFELDDYFGKTVQFPLKRSLLVHKGYIVALTVPTWAPALAVGLDRTNAWRSSRAPNACDDTVTQTAQQHRGSLRQYRCLYRTARLTYSATLVSTP